MTKENDFETFKLTAFPAGFMLLGGLSVFCFQLPGMKLGFHCQISFNCIYSAEKLVAAMQHFAAGIVICAVSIEIMEPVNKASSNTVNIVAISVGFFL